jgi:Family of unknown function (DUF6459)
MPDVPENLSPRSRKPAVRRPLPDAQAIRPLGVPEAAPPYDDEAPAGPREPGHMHLADGSGRELPGRGGLGVAVTGTWPSQFAQVLSETLAGSRPASQLTPWTTEQARKRISALGPVLGRRRVPGQDAPQPRVRRVIVSSPVQGVMEMTVIVDVGDRSRAVAVRLERTSPGDVRTRAQPGPYARRRQPPPAGGWLCTAIEAA